MSARRAVGATAALVVGVLCTWLLGVLTGSLLLPAAAVLAVAAAAYRVRPDIALGLGLGAVTATTALGWLFTSLGSGLSSV